MSAWLYRAIMATLVLCALAMTACQNDNTLEQDNTLPEAAPTADGNTIFASVAHLTRTSMDDGGVFYWSADDKIFVDKGTEGFKQPQNTAGTTGRYATFVFGSDEHFTANAYPVRYTGMNNASPNQVTIADNQTQSQPNNSDHFATSGDCGTATATLVGDRYEFTLDHKASYLILCPFTATAPMVDYCYLLGITVTDALGNTLYGTYTFNQDGLDLSSVASGGSTITLDLAQERNAAENHYDEALHWKDLTGELKNSDENFRIGRTADNKAYLVIQPGTHQLDITYRVAYFRLQNTVFETNPSTGGDWWHFTFDDNVHDYTVHYASKDYQPGYFYTVHSQLDLSPQEPVFQYNYSGYHQWDAQGSYWDFLTNDPTTYPDVPRTNNDLAYHLRSSVQGTSSMTRAETPEL